MGVTGARFVGVQLCFVDLQTARSLYAGVPARLPKSKKGTTQSSRTKEDSSASKGVESYPSNDKAVLWFEVEDRQTSIAATGRDRQVRG